MKLLKRTWADISLDALEMNHRMIRDHVGSGCRFLAVVKADAYGHGAVAVARAQTQFGAEYLAVSNLEEAIQIRRAQIHAPILIFGYTPASYAADMASCNITQEVHSLEYAQELDHALSGTNRVLKIHLKLDTGMSRLGFRAYNEADCLYEAVSVSKLSHLYVEGVFTHFSVSDSKEPSDVTYTKQQYDRFCRAIEYIRAEGLTPELCHCSNSGAVLQYPEYAMDMVRPGIASYGVAPSDDTARILPLRPVLSLHTTVSQIREYSAGTDVSYGRTYRTNQTTLVAVVSIGYADGLPRALSGKLDFMFNGYRAHQIGTICMDACMIDITDIPDIRVGSEVTIIGSSGNISQSASSLAGRCGSIPYEFLSGIGKRVTRQIRCGDEIIDTLQYII